MWVSSLIGPACRGVLSVACIVASAVLYAQSSGGEFELTKSTIDAGGGTSSGADFELTGTIAQPDADPQTATGGDFALSGGFWANADDLLFSDSFEGN